MASLKFQERMFVKAAFRELMANLCYDAFEDFFHRLMTARHPDFVQVRTHGDLGDLGADGLQLHDGRLYACYGPEVFDAARSASKFKKDLAKALTKRDGQFDTFVFVYNDARGLHPEVTRMLAQAAKDHATLKFEPMGPPHFLRELWKLVREDIEDLLGAPIPIHEFVYGIGLEDLTPLLRHLMTHRRRGSSPAPLREVPATKLDYNRLGDDSHEMLRLSMRYTPLVEQYYQGITDVTERDEVAADFSAYYRQVALDYDEPDQVIIELQKYMVGNERREPAAELALWVVLAYFFESCDIFEEPPPEWRPSAVAQVTG